MFGRVLTAGICLGALAASGIDGEKLTITSENWRLPANCSIVQEGQKGGDCIKVTGYAAVYSAELFAVDPGKVYQLSGSFRSVGETEGRVYLGLVPADESKRSIAPHHVNCVPGSETELAAACSPADTVIKVKDGSKWRAVAHAAIAFEIDDSGEFADLPNFNLSPLGVEQVEQKGDHWEVTLSRACGKEYPAGTKVRQHLAGASFIYCGAGNLVAPKEWTTFSGKVDGISKNSIASTRFHPGTKFVRIGILANHRGNQENVLLIDNITLEQVD